MRIVVTRGPGLPGIDPLRCPRATTLVLVYPFPPLLGSAPVTLITSSIARKSPRSVPARVKSLSYLDSVLAKVQANSAGAGDALMLDGNGLVAEVTGANVFVVSGKHLRTPPTTASLAGITRGTILDLAAAAGLEAVGRGARAGRPVHRRRGLPDRDRRRHRARRGDRRTAAAVGAGAVHDGPDRGLPRDLVGPRVQHPAERPPEPMSVSTIDLNVDAGESYGAWTMGDDAALFAEVSSANLACGFHAGDPGTIRTSLAAGARGRRRGRRASRARRPARLRTPRAGAVAAGGARRHAVPGRRARRLRARRRCAAAPRQAARRAQHRRRARPRTRTPRRSSTASAVVRPRATDRRDRRLAPASRVRAARPPGRRRGLPRPRLRARRIARRRGAAGRDHPRPRPGGAERAVRMALHGTVEAARRQEIRLAPGTLCIHGDNPGSVATARAVRAALRARGHRHRRLLRMAPVGQYLRFATVFDEAANLRVLALAASSAPPGPSASATSTPATARSTSNGRTRLLPNDAATAWIDAALRRRRTTAHEPPPSSPSRCTTAASTPTRSPPRPASSRPRSPRSTPAATYRVCARATAGQPMHGRHRPAPARAASRRRRASTCRRCPSRSPARRRRSTRVLLPGGWNVIGTALVNVYDPHRDDPFLFDLGDRVRFHPARASRPRRRPCASSCPPTPRLPALRVDEPGAFDLVVDGGRLNQAHRGMAQSGPLDAPRRAPRERPLRQPVGHDAARVHADRPAARGAADRSSSAPPARGFSSRSTASPSARPRRPSPPASSYGCAPTGHGVRGYLAVAGGIEAEPFLGSTSVDRAALVGRAAAGRRRARPGRADDAVAPARGRLRGAGARRPCACIRGPQWSAEAEAALVSAPFTVATGDRMGVRLEGPGGSRRRAAQRVATARRRTGHERRRARSCCSPTASAAPATTSRR